MPWSRLGLRPKVPKAKSIRFFKSLELIKNVSTLVCSNIANLPPWRFWNLRIYLALAPNVVCASGSECLGPMSHLYDASKIQSYKPPSSHSDRQVALHETQETIEWSPSSPRTKTSRPLWIRSPKAVHHPRWVRMTPTRRKSNQACFEWLVLLKR